MQRLGALIESGAAAEMMKAAGIQQEAPAESQSTDVGERRDPGTTTIRRPKQTDSTEATTDQAETDPAASVEAETTESVLSEVDAEEQPNEVSAEE